MKTGLARLALVLAGALPLAAVARFAPDATALALLQGAAPQAALALAQDPAVRGQVLFALRRWQEAAAAFAGAGVSQAYNQANALAKAGTLEAAIVTYDAALLHEPGEDDAGFNRALAVEALFRQRLAAAGQGAGSANAAASVRAKGRLDRMSANDTPSGTGDGMAAARESTSQEGTPGGGQRGGAGGGARIAGSGRRKGAWRRQRCGRSGPQGRRNGCRERGVPQESAPRHPQP